MGLRLLYYKLSSGSDLTVDSPIFELWVVLRASQTRQPIRPGNLVELATNKPNTTRLTQPAGLLAPSSLHSRDPQRVNMLIHGTDLSGPHGVSI